jgi:Rrf2 family protein
MRVTALEEYGLRCMVLLARSGEDNPLTLPEFSNREGVSIPYAGKLLMILKKGGLVKAVRGRKGGYVLAISPAEITLKKIFDALGHPVFSANHCERFTGVGEACIHTEDCSVRGVWQTFEGFIASFLQRVTLGDLASGDSELLKNIGFEIQGIGQGKPDF